MKYRSLYKNTHGVVMMETLLTLPLYLILLACLFWLGEVCLAKLTLVQSANLRLWEGSTQHAIAPIAENNLFDFLPGINGADVVTGRSGFAFAVRVNSSNDGATAAGWGRRRAGNGNITLRRSNWSWGVNSSALGLLSTGVTLPANSNLGMVSRQTPNLLSRNSYAGRQNIYTFTWNRDGTNRGRNEAGVWQNEFLRGWNFGNDQLNITPGLSERYRNLPLYNGGRRFASFVTWSQ